MAYNNGFPMTYQQMYPAYNSYNYMPQQAQQVQQQPQTQNSGIIWVQGEAGAKSYLVAPNTTVQLWDSESQTIYLKSADASGMPSMRIIDYTIRDMTPQVPQVVANDYPTRKEFEMLKSQIEAMKAQLMPKEVEHESVV